MSEWIRVKERIPFSGQKVKIKAQYHDDEVFEAVSTFYLVDIDERTEIWKWEMSEEDGKRYGVLRPTHWMPLPPQDN